MNFLDFDHLTKHHTLNILLHWGLLLFHNIYSTSVLLDYLQNIHNLSILLHWGLLLFHSFYKTYFFLLIFFSILFVLIVFFLSSSIFSYSNTKCLYFDKVTQKRKFITQNPHLQHPLKPYNFHSPPFFSFQKTSPHTKTHKG